MIHSSTAPAPRRGGIGRPMVALLVAVLACTTMAACDRLLSAERRIERAQDEFDVGEYAAAIRDVKTALEAEPDNVRGRLLLAHLALKFGDPATARKELDRALEAGAAPASVRTLHYAIFLAQGQYEDALIGAAADEDLEPLRKSVIMATAQAALGRNDEAGQSIDQALAIAPEDREALLIQARWLWATGKLKEAGDVLDGLLGREPQFAEASLFRGRFALGVGDAARAREAFLQARETASLQLGLPDRMAIHVGLVESQLALGNLPEATVELKSLEALAENAFVTRYLRARIAYATGENRVAAAELQRALGQQPDHVPARLLLGAALLADGATGQAEAELNRLVTDAPDNIEARKLLARLYLSRNDTAAARRVLAEAPAGQSADASVSWLAGAVSLVAGETDEAIVLLERGAAADPDNVPLKLDLARAYLLAGRADKAAEVARSIPAGEGGIRRRQLTVLAEVAGRPLAEARPRLARLVEENAQDPDLLVTAGSYLVSAGDAPGAAGLFERAIVVSPAHVGARLGLAATAFQAGDLARAAGQLQKVLEVDAKAERAYLGLAFIAGAQGDRDAARNWLEQAVGADPAVVESRLKLAELALSDNDPARANALVDQALAVTKDRPSMLNRVGLLYLQASQFDQALARFNQAAALGAAEADANAGATLISLGRNDEARARLEAAVSRRRDWAPPVVYLSALDAGQGRYDQALARVAAFEKAGGQVFVAAEIRGDILSAAGRHPEASAAYERAAAARPSSTLVVKNFRARKAAGRASPQAGLLDWLKANPRDLLVRVMLAEHYQLQGERKAAIAQYEQASQVGPTPPVLNNLAWLYYETGDERAQALARRAHEADPANAAIADTYGWILLEKGLTAEGLPFLEQAAKAAPEHPEIQYHYAAALARAGKTQDARTALGKLLRASPAFPSRGAAEKLLASLQ